MNSSNRIVLNTSIQYLRSLISIIVTLYTARLILESLGVNDYGIYSLIGGVVALFAFIQNSLSRTTQRYLNYHQGRKDNNMVVMVFNNSVICQLAISCFICVVLLVCINPVFNHLLNIAESRVNEARWVYILMTGSLFFNLQSAPYMAVLIARENILYSSLVQILDALLKIPIALSLFYIYDEKLVAYAFMMALLTALNFVLYFCYSRHKYSECQKFSFKTFDIGLQKKMLGFTAWSTYGTFAVVGRTQGIALFLNRAFSTAINAAFGIATQIIGQLSFLSTSIATAVNPQMTKAEGAGNRNRAIRLTEISSKYSCLLLSLALVPAFFYIDFILNLWLKDVPENTSLFCRFIILITLVDLITINLNNLNGAIGNIKKYSILIYTLMLLTLPPVYIVLQLGYGALGVMVVYLIDTIVCGLARLIYLHKDISLSISNYLKHVVVPVFFIVGLNSLIAYLFSVFFPGWGIIVCIICVIVCTILFCSLFGMQPDEKRYVRSVIDKFKPIILNRR